MFHLDDPMLGIFLSNNGTNCCSFLVLKTIENWHLEIKSIRSDRKMLYTFSQMNQSVL